MSRMRMAPLLLEPSRLVDEDRGDTEPRGDLVAEGADEGRDAARGGAAHTPGQEQGAHVGAAGDELNMNERWLRTLRSSLNPLSRYEFGKLSCLRNARDWQAT